MVIGIRSDESDVVNQGFTLPPPLGNYTLIIKKKKIITVTPSAPYIKSHHLHVIEINGITSLRHNRNTFTH